MFPYGIDLHKHLKIYSIFLIDEINFFFFHLLDLVLQTDYKETLILQISLSISAVIELILSNGHGCENCHLQHSR